FLHISKAEQKQRLLDRINDPLKNWKFQAGDLDERKRWGDYTAAYEAALERCSTKQAPWFVVPADHKSTRDLLVTQVVVDALERMDPKCPKVDPAVLEIAKKWEAEGKKG